MKRIALFLWTLFSCIIVRSQQLQVHYDFRPDRNYITTTLEHFAPDAMGSTFFFIDFNHSKSGPSEAYWELARELKFSESPWSAHLEYNGGLNRIVPFAINNAYLLGATYSMNANDFSKGFSVSAMYKYIQGNAAVHNYQITGVWYLHSSNQKFSFTGFADFWREKHVVYDDNVAVNANYVFLTEPQLWYNINKFFSIGTELELSTNFGAIYGLKFFPTIAAKWIIN